MFAQFYQKRSIGFRLALLVIVIAGAALAVPGRSLAHCDSVQGPVAIAAQKALESGDVKLVLPYVKPEAEAELTAAFKQARDVRKGSPKVRALADQYFMEVAVRLHREGEGAPYTGLKNEPVPAAIQAADQAMVSGEMNEVYHLLEEAIQEGVKEKYEAVLTARKEAEKLGTTEAHRERVEAELLFEKYVYELYSSATAANPHAEGATAHGEAH